MPTLVPADQFAECEALAAALMARAREVATAQAFFPEGTADEAVALSIEVQAFGLAMMGAARISPMAPRPMFVAFGAGIGVILAQQTEPPGELMKACFDQMRSTFDQIVAQQQPQGSC